MPRRTENRRTRDSAPEPPFGWNNIVMFKPRNPGSKIAYGGYLQIDVRFLEEIIARYEEGSIEMTDDDRIQLRVYVESKRARESNAQYLRGGIAFDEPYEPEEDEEPAPRARRGRAAAAPARGRGRRAAPVDNYEEEDDEPPARGRGRRRR